MTNVKEEDPISHGAHVAGTAVGNASQPSPNGEIIRGVCSRSPTGCFYVVFSDTKGGQVQNFIYTKAVEGCGQIRGGFHQYEFGNSIRFCI